MERIWVGLLLHTCHTDMQAVINYIEMTVCTAVACGVLGILYYFIFYSHLQCMTAGRRGIGGRRLLEPGSGGLSAAHDAGGSAGDRGASTHIFMFKKSWSLWSMPVAERREVVEHQPASSTAENDRRRFVSEVGETFCAKQNALSTVDTCEHSKQCQSARGKRVPK